MAECEHSYNNGVCRLCGRVSKRSIARFRKSQARRSKRAPADLYTLLVAKGGFDHEGNMQ